MTTPVEPEPHDTPWLSLSLAGPIDVLSQSYGSIETDRLFDFGRGCFHESGLFSERIFGPIRDYHCTCKKFQGIAHESVVCDACGVAVRPRSIRRDRMAHIALPVPIPHPWFWGHDHAPIELLLGLSHRRLKRLVQRRQFIRLTPPPPHLQATLVSAAIAQSEGDRTLDGFLARSGGDAVLRLLTRMNTGCLLRILEARLHGDNAVVEQAIAETLADPATVADILRRPRQLAARVRVLRQIVRAGVVPQHAVLEYLPVIPAGLRCGRVAADGRIAVDGVTAMYRRILRLCHAVRTSLEGAPVAQRAWPQREGRRRLVRLERRLGDEIARLFKHLIRWGSAASGATASFSRRRTIGKRVDYSACSVLVPDPSLRLFECRLPRRQIAEVWQGEAVRDYCLLTLEPGAMDARKLESEIAKLPVVVSVRSPSFATALASLQPRLTEDRATHVHPLALAAWQRSISDADAALHLPLSVETVADCDRLSFPRSALRNPVNGKCDLTIAGDAAVGCCYASWLSPALRNLHNDIGNDIGRRRTGIAAFATLDDVQLAWEERRVRLHDLIEIRLAAGQPFFQSTTDAVDHARGARRACTTVGRALVNRRLPAGSPFFDVRFDANDLRRLVEYVLHTHGELAAEHFVERTARFGLTALSRSGLSLCQTDLRPAPVLADKQARLMRDVAKFTRLYDRGVICDMERRSQIYDHTQAIQEELALANVDVWESAAGAMPLLLAAFTSRGYSRDLLHRLVGIVGTVWTPWTFQLPAPVLTSLAHGVDVQGYFQLAAASRHAAVNKLRNSQAPTRLARRVAAALAETLVTQRDCGVRRGVIIDRERDEATAGVFASLIEGRTARRPVSHPSRLRDLVAANELITRQAAQEIAGLAVNQVEVRSPLECLAPSGVCQKCYGADPATGELAELGAPVGVKAALAIGDALQAINDLRARELDPEIYVTLQATHSGIVSLAHLSAAPDERGAVTVVSLGGVIEVHDDDGVVHKYRVPHGAILQAASGQRAEPGAKLAAWNLRWNTLYASTPGTVRFASADPASGPRLMSIVDEAGVVLDAWYLPADAKIPVAEGAKVAVGDSLASYVRSCGYGLAPSEHRFERLKLLLSGRRSTDRARLAPIDARVELIADLARRRCTILLHPRHGGPWRQVHVPWGAEQFPMVRTGQIVQPGDPLTRGQIDLADLLRTRGRDHVLSLLTAEVHARLSDLKHQRPADDRPWEILLAQMLGYVRVVSSGDTDLPVGAVMPRGEVLAANRTLHKKLKVHIPPSGATPPQTVVISRREHELNEQRWRANPEAPQAVVTIPWPIGWRSVLLGVDALARRGSFLSARGFRPSRRGLVEAALTNCCQPVNRIQESLIAGRLMPAGSGWADAAAD